MLGKQRIPKNLFMGISRGIDFLLSKFRGGEMFLQSLVKFNVYILV